ncbi:type 1 glutamine amidotransferase family protein [Streptomyces europaeiscabiei]|uniref:hypothetical protein n=1 Tax=Streptomyces europaeiscabiei TaxID=146819 RepID=UPI0038D38B6C
MRGRRAHRRLPGRGRGQADPDGGLPLPSSSTDPDAMCFVRDAYRHGKPIGALGSDVGIVTGLHPEGVRLSSELHRVETDRGVVTDTARGRAGGDRASKFVAATTVHRPRDRPPTRR